MKSWAAGGLPENAVVALPREELEGWLLAANTKLKEVESESDPVTELVSRGLLLKDDKGRPEKRADNYRKLAKPLGRLCAKRSELARIPELQRFIEKAQTVDRAGMRKVLRGGE